MHNMCMWLKDFTAQVTMECFLHKNICPRTQRSMAHSTLPSMILPSLSTSSLITCTPIPPSTKPSVGPLQISSSDEIYHCDDPINVSFGSLADLHSLNALEFCGISLWQIWDTESWKNVFLLEQPVGHLLSTEVLVLSDHVLCVWEATAPFQTWASKLSETWDSSIFKDKCDITGRPVQAHCHLFSGCTSIHIKREIPTFLGSTEPCDFKGRIIFMSMFNDIDYRKRCNEQTCLESVTEVTEHTKQFQLGHGCFCGLGRERVAPYELGQTSQTVGSHHRQNDTEI